jgi:hypothetical protein
MSPCHRGDRFPRLAARLDDPKLLSRRPAPPTPRSSDQFNPLIVVRHRHVLEDIPKPSELCRVSGRNGGQFRFSLEDHVEVESASFENGLLQINLVRRIPEAMKPRRVQIDAGAENAKDKADKAKTIDHIRAAS